MRRRWTALASLWALALAAPGIAAPQPAASLDGLWTNATSTPLERHRAFGALLATPDEAAAWAKAMAEADLAQTDPVGGRQSEWFDRDAPMMRVGGAYRTSLIVEPANGRLPYTAKGRELALEGFYGAERRDGPEARPVSERCLTGADGAGGAPLLPANDNSNYRIVQTPDAVVISAENGGAVRIVRMGAKHLPPQMVRWGGDSIGRWDGATLVVETTNFRAGEAMRSPRPLYISPAAKVTERFTRTGPGEILYQFTVDDPAIYRQPWRGEFAFRPSKGREFEYACHEGNYSLANVLAGARHEEAEAWRPNSTPRAAGGN